MGDLQEELSGPEPPSPAQAYIVALLARVAARDATIAEQEAEIERLRRARDERDLFAEIIRDPAKLLNLLLDARGVEAAPDLLQWGDGLPAAIRISADLASKVFARSALDTDQPPRPTEPKCDRCDYGAVCLDCGHVAIPGGQ